MWNVESLKRGSGVLQVDENMFVPVSPFLPLDVFFGRRGSLYLGAAFPLFFLTAYKPVHTDKSILNLIGISLVISIRLCKHISLYNVHTGKSILNLIGISLVFKLACGVHSDMSSVMWSASVYCHYYFILLTFFTFFF